MKFSPLAFLPPPDLTWIRTEERGWFRTISWICCFIIMVILLTWNTIKWYQDLFTKERKSLNRAKSVKSRSIKRESTKMSTLSPASSSASSPSTTSSTSSTSSSSRKKPPLTIMYRVITTCVELSIFFYFLGTFVGFLSVWGVGCEWIFIFALSSWEMAKGLMYIVFIARLYTAFDNSPAYRYPPKCLLTFACIVGLIAFILAILCAINGEINPHVRYDHLKQTCGAFFPPVLTSTISLFDFIMVFVCVFLFIYPLVSILSLTDDEDVNKNKSRRIVHVGMKYLIVSGVAAVTSFASLLSITMHAETTPAAWDMSINSICMMLMMPYYADYMFYDRLCCPCVSLCDVLCLKYNKVYRKTMGPGKMIALDLERVRSNDDETENTKSGDAAVSLEVASDEDKEHPNVECN